MYVRMYVCTYVCMHVCMYVCMHIHMYVCTYVCMHVCMYARMYVCSYSMSSPTKKSACIILNFTSAWCPTHTWGSSWTPGVHVQTCSHALATVVSAMPMYICTRVHTSHTWFIQWVRVPGCCRLLGRLRLRRALNNELLLYNFPPKVNWWSAETNLQQVYRQAMLQ